jgi:hypothetical protein
MSDSSNAISQGTEMSQPTSDAVIHYHDSCLSTVGWSRMNATHTTGIWQWIEANHRFNNLLWDEEDLARRRNVADGEIAINKRNIDVFNQKRNDAVERVDDLLLQSLATAMQESAPLHSETAGMMIDRMSIMALKIKAMHAQTLREDVDATHIANCTEKLARLNEQRTDLADCYDRLIADCRNGHARYKIYRQFKMYNDATLNPALYAK